MSVGEYYDTYWETSGYAGATELNPSLRRLLERFAPPGGRCLDVGCGDGGTTGEWLSANGDSYLGVDVSSTAVDLARARGLDAQVVADAGALPFDPGSFDLAVCIEVLEHLLEPAAALAEMRRVVRPGGTIILTVPNIAHWRTRADLALLGRWAGRGDARSAACPWLDPHIRFFTIRSLGTLVRESELELTKSGGYSDLSMIVSVPGLRKTLRDPRAGMLTRLASRVAPSFAASRAYAVAVRPPS